jgi:N-ethylmaleimide reductase
MNLFSQYALGPLSLPNRVVMAPMTRSRAIGNVPNELGRTYYTQRASAGLLITEGTAPSPDGLGYARIPGLYDEAQVAGWRRVTDAVHEAGGRIVVQLMHVGRIAHRLNMPAGARIVAPSALRAEGLMFTDQEGRVPFGEPEALDAAGVADAREGFVKASRNAIAAGFDGVELHGANGYLLEQFLHPHANRRTDAYGGSAENRNRFVIEVARACAEAIGAERVGIRFSPFGTNGDLAARTSEQESDETRAQYVALAEALRGLLYVHVVRTQHARTAETASAIRTAFGGPFVLNGGFDRESAEAALASGAADLVSFGRQFISNPDLVARMREGHALAPFRPELFFSPGAEGYVDYPAAT